MPFSRVRPVDCRKRRDALPPGCTPNSGQAISKGPGKASAIGHDQARSEVQFGRQVESVPAVQPVNFRLYQGQVVIRVAGGACGSGPRS